MKDLKITLTIILIAFFSYTVSSLPGSGTEASPYLVSTKAHLNEVRNNLTAFYKQEADIVFESADFQINGAFYNSGAGWEPISGNGTTKEFTGSYDGNGKTITNLVINRGGTANVGLFGHLGRDSDGAIIKNLKLVNVNIIGGRGTGALVGRITGDQKSRIENCSATGTVIGDAATGGLVGSNNSYQTNSAAAESFRPVILASWANVNVFVREGAPTDNMIKFGGLTGCNQKGLISNSYSRGNVTINNQYASRVGGLTGCVELRGIAINSYSTGTVTTHESVSNVGGFIGNLGVGNNSGTITNCFYDGTSTKPDNDIGQRHSTSDMKISSSFSGWDFTNVWNINSDENDGYPYLLETEPTSTLWIWKGGVTGNTTKWDQDGNWMQEGIPPSGAVVSVPDVQYQPVIPQGSTNLHKITLESGATLDIPEGNTLIVTGSIVSVSGTQIPEITGDGELVLAGSTHQELPTMIVKNIIINNFNNVILSGDLTIKGALTMQNGLLDLNGYNIDLGTTGKLNEWEDSNNGISSRVFGNSGTITAIRTKDYLVEANLGIEIITDKDLGNISIRRGHNPLAGKGGSMSVLRWFDIVPSQNNEDVDATVIFTYTMADLIYTGTEVPGFSLFKKPIGGNADSWEHIPAEVFTTSTSKRLVAQNVERFSTWTAANSETPMPILLLSFQGKQVNECVELSWVTAAEINNDYFTIERSANGLDFIPIAFVEGSGTTSQMQSYSITDIEPRFGLTYYRLKQTDFDGQFEYFKPLAINRNTIKNIDISIYPNPGNGNFNLYFSGDESLEYLVVDMQGRTVATGSAEPGITNFVSMTDLRKGIYSFVILSHEVITKKIQVL